MAKIRIKDTVFSMQDGTVGTALVNEPTTPPPQGGTQMDIDAVVLTRFGTNAATQIPLGAHFTAASESGTPDHTITAKVETVTDITDNITFTPVLASALADNDPIVITGITLDFKVGEGNVTWTETVEYDTELERGDLETGTVSAGDDQAMTVTAAFTFQAYTTGTSETVSPVDAIKGVGGASEWVTAGADECEPYAVKLIALHTPTCGSKQTERYEFPEFRRTNLNPDFSAATISLTGVCKAVEPTVTRI